MLPPCQKDAFLRFATNVGFAQLLLYATIGDSFFCIERLFNQPLKKPGSYRMSQEATEKLSTRRADLIVNLKSAASNMLTSPLRLA